MIYNSLGTRKYLTAKERRAFIWAAKCLRPEAETFCLVLAYTGARISEVLALTPAHVDRELGIVVIRCLKKRRSDVYRGVPIPKELLERLDVVHNLSEMNSSDPHYTERIWQWGRTTAWKLVKTAMNQAGVMATLSHPKALRHAYGVGCVEVGIPLNVVQRWMGHSRIATTTIYAEVYGAEERSMAKKMWKTLHALGDWA
jgi:site-specific recombinase XerD